MTSLALSICTTQSGTGELADDAFGAYASEKVYSDVHIAQIETLPSTAPHRPVDLLVVAADQAGYVRTHIVMPSIIYDTATGPLFDTGIANAHTVFHPLHVRAALKYGHVAVANVGASVWGAVHIDDSESYVWQCYTTCYAYR